LPWGTIVPASRRDFLLDVPALGLLGAMLPELGAAQQPAARVSALEAPHDSFSFWNGFFDSVNPYSPDYGTKAGKRGPTDQLPDTAAQTQYLHYNPETKRLRYATDIGKEELLDYDGDVSVSLAISQFRPGSGDKNVQATQLRVDTTQIHPYMNIVAPLAWTAIASLAPDKAGKISLDDLGFKSLQATQGTSKILLTRGTGKLAVNISMAPHTSIFVKALNVMIQGAKMIAPIVHLPAISIPALSSFSEALAYWEDRTRFLMSGNLTSVVATAQALDDPDRDDHYISLVAGDYLMLPLRHANDLASQLPNLDLVQGFLVAKDADPNVPLPVRAQNVVPGVTYATMRVSVQPAPPPATPTPATPKPATGETSPSQLLKNLLKGGDTKQ
jgi:hypothetical protein